ncbi:outer membrane protein [Microbulbifer litoralis]|uniref:outer membrane protein n=1 Tax=Microbulbifer litoralis TaxID=2933965 RepID=UPI0020290A98|nr:outer membrane beta-barrel protein [Microbulbifer sp. GX H0434]
MTRPCFLLAVPFLTVCVSAQADFYSHRYAGVSFSNENLDGLCDSGRSTVQGFNSNGQTAIFDRCTETGKGWKIYGGWRWTPHLAVEASFQKLAQGSITYDRTDVQMPPPPVFLVPGQRAPTGFFPEWRERDDIDTALGNIFVVTHWPIAEGFSVFAKLGGGGWNSRLKRRISGIQVFAIPLEPEEGQEEIEFEFEEGPSSGTLEETRNGFHWSYGAGISYRHRNSWTIRAEWESFSDVGSDDFFTAVDVESASLGWSMHF